jgi:Zn-dependent protease
VSLLVPRPTRYDVNFRLLGFPVRVHPGFWVFHVGIAVVLATEGLIAGPVGPVVVFLTSFTCTGSAVLLHELGHTLAGRRFGADGEIVLTFLGGFAGTGIEAHRRGQRIVVYLAGPAVNILLAVVAAVGWEAMRPSAEELTRIYLADPNAPSPWSRPGYQLLELVFLVMLCINAPLGVWNLMPVPPLDGGKVLVEVVEWIRFGDRPEWERDADWWKRM